MLLAGFGSSQISLEVAQAAFENAILKEYYIDLITENK